MKTLLLSCLTVSVAVLSGLMLPNQSVHAATYFTCKPGYSFQVNQNSAARCFKAESFSYKSPLKCPSIRILNKSVGLFLNVDARSNKDMCEGKDPLGTIHSRNLACASGYTLDTKKGKDRCKKRFPAKAEAPSKRVNR
ncbi:MAG: hypothetical protein MI867_19650 [Pseudomonadales bacterium]|nr:hypothetical protein [Pseudomonadales bacterium]